MLFSIAVQARASLGYGTCSGNVRDLFFMYSTAKKMDTACFIALRKPIYTPYTQLWEQFASHNGSYNLMCDKNLIAGGMTF